MLLESWLSYTISGRQVGPRIRDIQVRGGTPRASLSTAFYESRYLETGIYTAGYKCASRILRSVHLNAANSEFVRLQAAAGPSEDLVSEALVAAQAMRSLTTDHRPTARWWAEMAIELVQWRTEATQSG